MNELYVISIFNPEGTFLEYARKGRGGQIVGYDNLASARRGLAQSRTAYRIAHQGYTAEIAQVCRTILIVDGGERP